MSGGHERLNSGKGRAQQSYDRHSSTLPGAVGADPIAERNVHRLLLQRGLYPRHGLGVTSGPLRLDGDDDVMLLVDHYEIRARRANRIQHPARELAIRLDIGAHLTALAFQRTRQTDVNLLDSRTR